MTRNPNFKDFYPKEADRFWNNETEKQFFADALKIATPEKLFYFLPCGKYAYEPKNINFDKNILKGQAVNGRNSLIGNFTERWCKTLFSPIAKKLNLFAVNGVICEEIGLPSKSSADLAFCTDEKINQKAENIKLIFEIKMSVISNYQFEKNQIVFIGDYKQHKGNPSLLRSDSMLKAIGKAINIRVSSIVSTKIPIIVLGNSPITDNYIHKVDFLKTSGVIQGFWSLNTNPTISDFIKNSPDFGFQTFENENQLFENCKTLINSDLNYFSSMISKSKLGNVIKISSEEKTDVARAEKFLTLIQSRQ